MRLWENSAADLMRQAALFASMVPTDIFLLVVGESPTGFLRRWAHTEHPQSVGRASHTRVFVIFVRMCDSLTALTAANSYLLLVSC